MHLIYLVTFSGDKPDLAATSVIQDSVISAAWGNPKPRKDVFDGKFVLQTRPQHRRLGIL